MKRWITHYYRKLTPVDIIVSAYCAIMICLVALRVRKYPETSIQYVLQYAAVLIAALVGAPAIDRVQHEVINNPFVKFLRYIYPMLLLGPLLYSRLFPHLTGEGERKYDEVTVTA
jgi:hypothetical protein